uniref:Uncharacterized protein n=1 Tax=Rhizophora mucronata TaxID=61149 RepID=A0A2P2PLS0_RHIMU
MPKHVSIHVQSLRLFPLFPPPQPQPRAQPLMNKEHTGRV